MIHTATATAAAVVRGALTIQRTHPTDDRIIQENRTIQDRIAEERTNYVGPHFEVSKTLGGYTVFASIVGADYSYYINSPPLILH